MDLVASNTFWMVLVFTFGYLMIIIESITHIHKSTVALLMAVACWVLFFCNSQFSPEECARLLPQTVESVSEIALFLMGALAVVETINVHQGFKLITDRLNISSKRKLLWVTCIITFFLSAILDNLTTTIVMVSLLRKIVPEKKDLLIFGGAVVIAANAGGVWTPIGDVTTTMLWIGGQVTTFPLIKELFLPSLACLLSALFWLNFLVKGHIPQEKFIKKETLLEPYGKLIFSLGLFVLIFVPIFKMMTGLPPFMGMLLGVGVLWLATDLVHSKCDEREFLRMPSILSKIDLSAVFFFIGILLSVGALENSGILHAAADQIQQTMPVGPFLALGVGLASAVIDNVPLVAASMGMFDLSTYPPDSPLWHMLAYTAGTGGSILIIGSAAGVAFMTIEKVTFGWFCRYISLPALFSYLIGFGVYLLLH